MKIFDFQRIKIVMKVQLPARVGFYGDFLAH